MANQKIKGNISKNNSNKSFILTKKIAKHGSQSIIIVPRILEQELKPNTIVQLRIDVIREAGK